MQTVPRLYDTFQPTEYKLKLHLEEVSQRRFAGEVLISGTAQQNGEVRLHSKDLVIESVAVGDEAQPFQLQDDLLIISSPLLKSDQSCQLTIAFRGTVTDSMHGLYPCYYEHDGAKKELFATQFESHHAREVFPCIDEPEAKATFDLTLITTPDNSVLSNMPARSQEVVGDTVSTVFKTTPRMSTYLLAFVIGELQSKSATTKDGVAVTTWATHAQPATSLDFGLDVAVRSIEFFNDYFGTPYPFPKADHVALPDFSSGAMENWGLITYREVCLLADEHTGVSTREYVATVIAHETSHQWFGNLVTMKWWDDLWLNESFATLMEYVCVDALFPKWNIWMSFATQEVLSALRRDYLPGVQAIKTAVNHPDEISTLFDPSIVYAKGARTLAMCRAFVGDTAFQQGLSSYFQKHQYGNTIGADLWAELSAASGKDVAAFMTPWIEQSGFPKIKVEVHGDKLRLRQSPFVIPRTDDSTHLWPVPLAAEGIAVDLLAEPSITVAREANHDFVLLNHDATTHAVIDYSPDLQDELRSAVSQQKLAAIDRLSLLHDLSLLSRAGDRQAVDLLAFLDAYRQEKSEPVWDIIALTIGDLRRLIEGDEDAEVGLKQRIIALALPNYERLGWQEEAGESESDTKLRATVISLLAYAEEPTVIASGLEDFRSHDKLSQLSGELRPIIFAIATKHGTESDIERLLATHHATNNSELQNDIVSGLTASHDPRLLRRLVGMLKDESIVRRQDLFRWFASLIRNRYGREMTWEWLTDNWSWIEQTFAGDKSYDNFARYSASGFSTHEWLDRYEAFFAPKRTIPALTRAIDLGIADIRVRADWTTRDRQALIDSLTIEE